MLNAQSLTAPSTVGREAKALLEKVAIMAPKLEAGAGQNFPKTRARLCRLKHFSASTR